MKTIVVCPVGTDLASRRSAAILRADIEAIVTSGEKAVIDLSNVESVSESYADELFGILAHNYGLQRFSLVISICGASSEVLRRVAGAVKERLAQNDLQSTLHTLVAAKHTAQKCMVFPT